MANLPTLTKNQRRVLSAIAESEDVLLFDLEVQELAQLGLVEDNAGVLGVTVLGRAVLRALPRLSAD